MRLIDADKLMESLNPNESVWVGWVLAEQVANAETVKAIPIEWILNKYKGKWGKAEMGRRDFQFIEVIDELLADWEKENEIDR